MASMLTVCNPGDKVVVFSPFYENYGADAILSGAQPIYVPLNPPEFNFDANVLEDAMKQFTTPETLMQPMLMEVFTDKEKDTTLLREYYHGLKNKPNE